jgi:hypothetical protein
VKQDPAENLITALYLVFIYAKTALTLKGRSVVNLLQFFMVFFGQFLYKFYNKKIKNIKIFFAIVKKSIVFLQYQMFIHYLDY